MKHYLDLVPVTARVRRRRSQMTRFCIFLAAALVMTIFGMADMEIRSERIQTAKRDGNWQVCLDVSEEQAELIRAWPQVGSSSWYGVFNYSMDQGFQIDGAETVILGLEPEGRAMFPGLTLWEGTWPEGETEACFTGSVRSRLGAKVGDTVRMTLPNGETKEWRISGFLENVSLLTRQDVFGALLDMDGYLSVDETASVNRGLYLVFEPGCPVERTVKQIQEQFGLTDRQIARNTKLLALYLQSADSYVMKLYVTGALLAVLVIASGVLMLAGSMNSDVARRTEYFGLLRCLGAEPRQVARLVRREALGWCASAIPAAAVSGSLLVWLLCAMLRYLAPGMFSGMPVFGISFFGIGCSAVMGILTALLAARSPAKKAASVSPLTAVSGGVSVWEWGGKQKRIAGRQGRVELSLGFHHACGSRKNLFLISGSFAFFMILFLCFTTLIDLFHHGLRPIRPYAPDLTVSAAGGAGCLPEELADVLGSLPGVKCVYGRRHAASVPAAVSGAEAAPGPEACTVSEPEANAASSPGAEEIPAEQNGPEVRALELYSYEEKQFSWAKRSLLSGSVREAENGEGVLAVYQADVPLRTGDVLTVTDPAGNVRSVPVTGILSDGPFDQIPGTDTVICSEALFAVLTGQSGYAVLDLQLDRLADEADAEEIRESAQEYAGMAGLELSFSDKRLSNREAKGAWYSFCIFVYGFLVVIALICACGIVNCISMSVSARMRQYGMMRAVGMENAQVVRMVAAEAASYGFFGIVFGIAAGLPLHRLLFEFMISSRWGTPWSVPWTALFVILLVVGASIAFSVTGPARRIRRMSVVETIGTD